MIQVLMAVYFSVGLILVLFGPAKINIAREVDKVKNFKPNSRSNARNITKNKIILFRLIITAGFILIWPLFLPGVLKDNQRSVNIFLSNNLKKSFKGKKFKCPKCNLKKAVEILYGYPSPETLQAWHSNEIELGGCIVGREMFNRKCINCNYQWETK
jgi:DNA-directed RNA polymerase subunit M/transcription elongation factor TFIIS